MTEKAKDFTEAVAELDRLTDVEAEQWVREGRSVGVLRTIGAMISSFFGVYFIKGSCKKSVPGLFEAVNAGMKPFLSYAKYWEKKKVLNGK